MDIIYLLSTFWEYWIEASCDGCQLGLINAQKRRSSFSSGVLKENKNSALVSPLNVRKMGTSSLAM